MSSDMDVVKYDYHLSRFNVIADFGGIGWRSIEGQMTGLQPTKIPEEVQELEILISVTFLPCRTRDPTVQNRIPRQRRTSMCNRGTV